MTIPVLAHRREVFIGVDVGTQGVRVAAIDETGTLVASTRQSFALSDQTNEQSPEDWWSAVVASLQAVGATLATRRDLAPVALSVTSTSGTVVPLDDSYRFLHNALMYSDKRATEEAAELAALSPTLGANSSWALPKLLWFSRQFPDVSSHIRAWRHAGDVILGRLTGIWDATDLTSALKTGFDPVAMDWPVSLFDELRLPRSWFPDVLPSGTVIGGLTPAVITATGLPGAILVTTGMTDGCASQVASGAVRPGDWNTTIGTTMVVKGVTRRRIDDPLGRVYSHRHPDGYWLPGGASNTGADWIARDYDAAQLPMLDEVAESLIPTGAIAYPLRQPGERFPFIAADAIGFDPPGLGEPALYAARLEGVAYLERLALDLLADLSGEQIKAVYTAGGGSQNDLWLRIRSNVLQRAIHRAELSEGAVGAAIVAATGTRFGSLTTAAAALIKISTTVEPDVLTDQYQDGYRRFVDALHERGYLITNGVR